MSAVSASKQTKISPIPGEAINVRADGREGDALDAEMISHLQGPAVARSQQTVLASLSALAHGSNGVNDVPRGRARSKRYTG
jgi:hypothetical protein